jgi:outer membrane receptor for ferric coprogen and ferric-rhodotorulic acid
MFRPLHSSSSRRFLVCAWWSALISSAATAQTLPASASISPSAKDAPVVELSPFEVTTGKDTGYQASDTLAGSRLRTNLGDVASSVSVFTAELISDIGAFNEFDIMRYSAAAEPERTDQTPAAQGILPLQGAFNFRVRGQTATRARNYFETNLSSDTFNTETIEEARGPNAILFGIGGAGGVYNTSTKQAILGRNPVRLGLAIDNFGQRRGTLDYNKSFGKKFAVRLNAVEEASNGWQPYGDTRNERLAFAATYRPWKNFAIKLDSEYGKTSSPTTRNFLPIDGVSAWRLNGSPQVANGVITATNAQKAIGINNWNAANPFITLVGNDNVVRNFQGTAVSAPVGSFTSAGTTTPNLANSSLFPDAWHAFDTTNPYPKNNNFFGPGGRVTNGQGAYNLSVELEPVKNLFVNVASAYDEHYNHIYDFVPGYVPAGMNGTPYNTIFGEPAQTFRDGSANPYAGDYYISGRWVYRTTDTYSSRYRLTTAYTFDLGKVFGHHSIAGLLSRDRTDAPARTLFFGLPGSPFAASPFANQNLLYFRQYITTPSNIYQWAVPSYESLAGKSVSVVLSPGAAPVSYPTGWINNSNGPKNVPIQVERAALVSMQNYFWNDRIVTTAGIRRTLLWGWTPTAGASRSSVQNSSYGIVIHATPSISPYFNFSQNAVAPSSVQVTIPNNNLLPINKGEGYDTGLTLKLLQDRVTLRLGYYKTTSLDQAKAYNVHGPVVTRNQNIIAAIQTFNAANPGSAVAIPAFAEDIAGGDFDTADVITKGYEANLIANLASNWRMTLSATKSTSVTTNILGLTAKTMQTLLPFWQTPAIQNLPVPVNSTTVAQEVANFQTFYNNLRAGNGLSTVGHPELQVRLFTRYDVRTTAFKGLFFGGGFSYNGSNIVGYNTISPTGQNIDAGVAYRNAPVREADILLGYQMRLPERFRRATLTFQFNAQNILHQHDELKFTAQGDGQIVRAGFVAPPRYALSTTLAF